MTSIFEPCGVCKDVIESHTLNIERADRVLYEISIDEVGEILRSGCWTTDFINFNRKLCCMSLVCLAIKIGCYFDGVSICC